MLGFVLGMVVGVAISDICPQLLWMLGFVLGMVVGVATSDIGTVGEVEFDDAQFADECVGGQLTEEISALRVHARVRGVLMPTRPGGAPSRSGAASV
jgi:hypothetical protein